MSASLETVVQLNDGIGLYPISDSGCFLTDILCFTSLAFWFVSLGYNT